MRHRWIVIGTWLALLVGINAIAGAVGPDYRTDFTLPDSESKVVQDLLEANDPNRAGFISQIVAKADQGVDDPEVQATLEQIYDYSASQDGITVTSPYDNPLQVSADGTINFAQLDVADRGFEEVAALGEEIVEYADTLPPVEGLRDRVRRRHLLRVRAPRERDLRLARGRHHPHPRLRFGARHGPPHRHRPVRARHRFGAGVARQQRDLDARLHHRDGGDDRHRRRHRLRAVHRDEIPRGIAARPRCRGVGGRGDGHQRTRRAVRGRHGDHLAAGSVPHGSGLRAGCRDRLVTRCAHDGARVAHPAAGAPRLGRQADRQHDSRRVDRRVRRGRRHVRRCGHRSGADLLRRPLRIDHLLRPQLRDQAVAQARPAPRRATQAGAVLVPLEPVHPAPAVAERALCGGPARAARAAAVRDPARVR